MVIHLKSSMLPSVPFPLHIDRGVINGDFPLHTHGFNELVIVLGGTGEHILDGNSYQLNAGDVFVLRGCEIHGFCNMRNFNLVNVKVDLTQFPFIHRQLLDLPGYHALFALEPSLRTRHNFASHLRLSREELDETMVIVDRLDAECTRREPGYAAMVSALYLELIISLARRYANQPHSPSQSLIIAGKVISYMEENFVNQITLDNLAECAGLSKNHLLRIFREATGKTPIEYLNLLRIQYAKELLVKTTLTITEIAAQAGTCDSNYFSRYFKKYVGISPKEFRKAAER